MDDFSPDRLVRYRHESGANRTFLTLWNALVLASESLRFNKLRTGLTALGMAIGTGSAILVFTIALTSRDYVLGQIQQIGSNMIYAYWEGADSVGRTRARADALTLRDMEAIREQIPDLQAVAAATATRDTLWLDHRAREATVLGVSPEFQTIRNLKTLAGRFLDERDEERRDKVCLVTGQLAKELYPGGWVEGSKIKVFGIEFAVVGVFKEGSETFGQSEITRETILIPISVIVLFTGQDAGVQIYASADRASHVPQATEAILQVIRSRHRGSAVYRAENLTRLLMAVENIATALTLVLLLVSAISLIVSGIGIMNIMLVTVTERTQEIGLRMALGAERKAIRAQFLTEALFLSLGGGLIGTVGGISLPLLVRHFSAETNIPISGAAVLVSLLVSSLCGILFGILPAEQASRLDPSEALRRE